MKKALVTVSALSFILAIGLTAFAVTQKLMSVQVKAGHVRSQPSFLAKVITKLAYGHRVEVVEEKKAWVKIHTQKKNSGWMHVSALTKKMIVFKPGDADFDKSASKHEVALAGKGFNEEVEKKYRSENKKLNYDEIDKLEKITVSQRKIQRFIEEGGLQVKGGEE
ncbi:MAG: SH3 domain-containing protein [Thermodesulfobacteriota bacterium]|nr:SH3 domain-containing protein [Thermodesulfobacteriota bacterium]